MQSFILISNTEQKVTDYLNSFFKKNGIDPLDQLTIDEEGSIGIAAIRTLQSNAYLSPYKGTYRAIIIHHAQNLTTESQNALLKLLEEPPPHLFLFLLSTTENFFLPTILSRCQLIQLNGVVQTTNSDEIEKQLHVLTSGTIGKKLALAELIAKEKENLSEWLGQSLFFAREKLLDQPENTQLLTLAQILQQACKDFQTTHVAPRVILEHYFLSFSSSE